ncbi:uncharacterized protein PG986_013387 [Apiospora aurea]|uniref:Uncharacterized protein n=1 Tax=Apiospora aurea TaxID=335848 RepID=A0ABR1PWG2_9PEZI
MSLTKLNTTGVYVVEVTPSRAPFFEAVWKHYAPQFNDIPSSSTSPLSSSRELPTYIIATKKLDQNEEDGDHEKRSKKAENSDSSDSKLEALAQFLTDLPPHPDCPIASPLKLQQKSAPGRRHRRRSSKLPGLQEVKDLADAEAYKRNRDMRTYAQVAAYPRHPRPYPPYPAPPPPKPMPWPNAPRPRPGLPNKRERYMAMEVTPRPFAV